MIGDTLDYTPNYEFLLVPRHLFNIWFGNKDDERYRIPHRSYSVPKFLCNRSEVFIRYTMSQSDVIVSTFAPVAVDEQISIPEFMTRYNPDDVPNDKVVHVDTITGKSITYGGLRQEAAKCAWGLRKLGLQEGDVVSVLLPNSVNHSCFPPTRF